MFLEGFYVFFKSVFLKFPNKNVVFRNILFAVGKSSSEENKSSLLFKLPSPRPLTFLNEEKIHIVFLLHFTTGGVIMSL